MRGTLVALVVLGGCYRPTVTAGIPCSDHGDCPSGQTCEPVTLVCGGVAPDASLDGPLADAEVPVDAVVLGAWGSPIPLPGIDSAAVETDPSLRADGLELLFASTRPGPGGYDLYQSTRTTTSDLFTTAVLVAELSTSADESGPSLSADGLTVVFRREPDIFRASRPTTGSPFGAAVRDDELSSPLSDYDPVISLDGLVAVVAREVAPNDRELYLYERASVAASWGTATHLAALSTPTHESGSALDPNGSTMWFHAGPQNSHDLQVSVRSGGAFVTSTPVAELNTNGDEGDPSVSPDLRTMVFRRNNALFLTQR